MFKGNLDYMCLRTVSCKFTAAETILERELFVSLPETESIGSEVRLQRHGGIPITGSIVTVQDPMHVVHKHDACIKVIEKGKTEKEIESERTTT